MRVTHDPRGGGPRCIRVENRAGVIEWLTFEEACAFEDQLNAALYYYEQEKWSASIAEATASGFLPTEVKP